MTTKTMDVSRIVFPTVNQVRYEVVPQTFELGPDDILIETEYSLISAGTELAKLTGIQKVDYPFVPGNRSVGKVIAVGKAVDLFQPGHRVFSHTPHMSHARATRLCVPIPAEVRPADSAIVGMALVAMTALRIGEVELGDRVAVIVLGMVGNLAAQLLHHIFDRKPVRP